MHVDVQFNYDDRFWVSLALNIKFDVHVEVFLTDLSNWSYSVNYLKFSLRIRSSRHVTQLLCYNSRKRIEHRRCSFVLAIDSEFYKLCLLNFMFNFWLILHEFCQIHRTWSMFWNAIWPTASFRCSTSTHIHVVSLLF